MRLSELFVLYESAIRIGAFATLLALLIGWEQLAPRRVRRFSLGRRWTSNFALLVLDAVALRLLMPAAAVGVAVLASQKGWGLFNSVDTTLLLSVPICFLALDLLVYFQHVLFHAVPVLWKVHRVHHADRDFDVSTGGRFHPIEIGLSMLVKSAAIIALGAPVLAVAVFELVLSSASLFNHSNIRIPTGTDRALRWLIVTPDMHRVHHSTLAKETNSNFGFSLPWWDRLLGTYRAQPSLGHERMEIGIRPSPAVSRCHDLLGMLAMPFVKFEGNGSASDGEEVG